VPEADSAAAISARSVEMTYPDGVAPVHAVKGVSLDIKRGEILLMMGPSGSGKTTLLSVLGGILTPTAGRVWVQGIEITKLDRREQAQFRRRHLGFIFQSFNLFAALTASENVELALNAKGVNGSYARRESQRLLSHLGLGSQQERLPRDLSGGEKQRVAIARALACSPDVIMADEPTSSLDAESGLSVTRLLRDVAREHETTVLIVSHDSRITEIADRVVHLDDGHF
jgi:putative ABC transport system ATP-binding protein